MRKDQSISQKLTDADTLIDNSLSDPEILAKTSLMGYDEAALNEGKQLKDEARALHLEQIKEYGEQYGATGTMRETLNKANDAYMDALQVSRIAYKKDVAAQNTLHLNGERNQSISGMLDQASVFYSNLLNGPDILTAMLKFGYDETKLQAEQALMEEARQAYLLQYKEKGDAQAATQKRDAKLDALDAWIYDYRTIARIALSEEPQKLERLGILVRS